LPDLKQARTIHNHWSWSTSN